MLGNKLQNRATFFFFLIKSKLQEDLKFNHGESLSATKGSKRIGDHTFSQIL